MAEALILPPERAGHVAPPDLVERREQLRAGVAAGLWRTDPAPVAVTLPASGGGRAVPALRWAPRGPVRGRLLHFHGGGFALGAPEIVGLFAAALAERTGFEVVAPRYRLAPEHPFPCGLIDALTTLRALVDEGADEPGEGRLPLVLSGDSAGGGLAASLALLARGQGLAIDGLVLLSPFLDLTLSGASYRTNGDSDPLFSHAAALKAAGHYLQGRDPAQVLASPLWGDLEGLPRVLISVGSGEVLADDSRRLAARLAEAGVPCRLLDLAGMDHVAAVRTPDLTGAPETLGAVVDLLGDIAPPH